MLEDEVEVLRLPIRSEPHHLVLAGVDLEAGVIGEGRVEQAERVGPPQFAQELELAASADADGGRRPLTNAVHGQNCSLFERGREEGARRMRLVVLGIEKVAFVAAQRIPQRAIGVEFLLDPERPSLEEGAEALGSGADVRLEDALELEQRLVVEADERKVLRPDAALLQAELDGAGGEVGVSLLAREPLLRGRRDDPAILYEAGGAVVVESGDAED